MYPVPDILAEKELQTTSLLNLIEHQASSFCCCCCFLRRGVHNNSLYTSFEVVKKKEFVISFVCISPFNEFFFLNPQNWAREKGYLDVSVSVLCVISACHTHTKPLSCGQGFGCFFTDCMCGSTASLSAL